MRSVVLGLAILLMLMPQVSASEPHSEIVLPGVSASGIFDPSIADTPPGSRLWMCVSTVDPSKRWPAHNTRVETSRLAYSDDAGAHWMDSGIVANSVKDVAGEGSWVNETSSLVYDGRAPVAERWKLFWHHYLEVDQQGKFEDGWIGYKTASIPEGLATAQEIKLFGGKGYDAKANDPHSDIESPLAGPLAVALNDVDDSLKTCVAFSEPSVVVMAQGLRLAISCYEPNLMTLLGGGVSSRVVLLSCAAPCRVADPKAWHYNGTLLTNDEKLPDGRGRFTGSDLFAKDGQLYLTVSPTSNRPVGGAYNGCVTFHIADPDHAVIEKTGEAPRVVTETGERDGSFNGACTYKAAATQSGFIYGAIDFSGKQPLFRLYATKQNF